MTSSHFREPGRPGGPSGKDPERPLRAVLVATGTEIALGRTVDTNCAFLAELLAGWGIMCARHLTVADDLAELEKALRECWEGYDLTVMTGGLGPTEDDWTRLAAARAFGSPLLYSPDTAAAIRGRMGAWGFGFPPANHRQAWTPGCARVIPNARGTAPAFAVVEGGRAAVFLPGVPREAEFLAETELMAIVEEILPGGAGTIATFTMKAAGLGEGRVDELLKDILRGSRNPYVGLSAGLYETRILVTASAACAEEAEALAAPVMEEIEARLGKHLAGVGEGGMRASVAEILRRKRLRLGVIDSITGGVLAKSLLEHLPPECLAGAVSCAPGRLHGMNAQNYLSVEEADLVMSLSSKSSPPAGPDASQAGKITVVTHIRDSRPKLVTPSWARRSGQKAEDFFQITPMSGPQALLHDRVAALACFQLWGFLRDKG
ncbi:MAG: hypothetical protein LBQ79_02595 [Deltaproteobacteria bacterium]|jgi:molybdenum cofactor synthesis domain-containing protein|nr:hypothetical protein [Deltaproteobacteria bacterium]